MTVPFSSIPSTARWPQTATRGAVSAAAPAALPAPPAQLAAAPAMAEQEGPIRKALRPSTRAWATRNGPSATARCRAAAAAGRARCCCCWCCTQVAGCGSWASWVRRRATGGCLDRGGRRRRRNARDHSVSAADARFGGKSRRPAATGKSAFPIRAHNTTAVCCAQGAAPRRGAAGGEAAAARRATAVTRERQHRHVFPRSGHRAARSLSTHTLGKGKPPRIDGPGRRRQDLVVLLMR